MPRPERGERINVGVVVFCRPLRFLAARTALDERAARGAVAGLDPGRSGRTSRAVERIAAGDPEAGPIAQLDETARFHWLVSPEHDPPSAVDGLCSDPAAELDKLFDSLVLTPAGAARRRPRRRARA